MTELEKLEKAVELFFTKNPTFEQAMEKKTGHPYKPREGQIALAKHIANGLAQFGTTRAHRIGEAPTGTGKSVAAIVAGVLWAALNESPHRVVISTTVRSLQDQLMRDLEMLSGVFARVGAGFSYVCIKGRDNYLCRSRLRDAIEKAPRMKFKSTKARIDLLRRIERCGENMRDDIFTKVKEAEHVWDDIYAESGSCTADTCGGGCLYPQVVAEASRADVLVTNHAYIFTLMSKLSGYYTESVVTPRSALIIDECKEIPKVASTHFGEEHKRNGLKRMVSQLAKRYEEFCAEYEKEGDHESWIEGAPKFSPHEFEVRCDALRREIDEFFKIAFDEMTRKGMRVDGEKGEMMIKDAINELPQINLRIRGATSDAFIDVDEDIICARSKNGEMDGDELKVLRSYRALEHRRKKLNDAADMIYDWAGMCSPKRFLYLGSASPSKRKGGDPIQTIKRIPIHVDDILRARLWGAHRGVAMMSGTLTLRGDWTHFAREVGAQGVLADDQFLIVKSPFDLSKQMRVQISLSMPHPKKNAIDYENALCKYIPEIVAQTGGRALVLFTARALMERVFYSVASEIKKTLGVTVLLQTSECDTHKLAEQFRNDETSVLFGTYEQYGRGADFAGDTLKHVIITRLPFEVPTDIYKELMRQRHPEKEESEIFPLVSKPNAMLGFLQACGRLIRRETDSGIVTILDCRVAPLGFLRALPRGVKWTAAIRPRKTN